MQVLERLASTMNTRYRHTLGTPSVYCMYDRRISARSAWRVEGRESEGALANVCFGRGGKTQSSPYFFIILNEMYLIVLFELAQLAGKDRGKIPHFSLELHIGSLSQGVVGTH